MAGIQIAVINASSVLTDDQVQAAVPALQAQVHTDFAPAWGIDADLTFVPTGSQPAPGPWWLSILDNSDQAGALGYHDVTDQGLPLGKVFAGSDLQMSLQWTVTASHELLEMLGDPEINLTVFVQSNAQTAPCTPTRSAMHAKLTSTDTQSTAPSFPISSCRRGSSRPAPRGVLSLISRTIQATTVSWMGGQDGDRWPSGRRMEPDSPFASDVIAWATTLRRPQG